MLSPRSESFSTRSKTRMTRGWEGWPPDAETAYLAPASRRRSHRARERHLLEQYRASRRDAWNVRPHSASSQTRGGGAPNRCAARYASTASGFAARQARRYSRPHARHHE